MECIKPIIILPMAWIEQTNNWISFNKTVINLLFEEGFCDKYKKMFLN